jgi:hypothetical protein
MAMDLGLLVDLAGMSLAGIDLAGMGLADSGRPQIGLVDIDPQDIGSVVLDLLDFDLMDIHHLGIDLDFHFLDMGSMDSRLQIGLVGTEQEQPRLHDEGQKRKLEPRQRQPPR